MILALWRHRWADLFEQEASRATKETMPQKKKKIRTKPNKAKDKTKTGKCEMRPRGFLKRKPVLEDHSMLPNMLAPQAEKRKTGCNLTALLSLNLLLGQEQFHHLPRN